MPSLLVYPSSYEIRNAFFRSMILMLCDWETAFRKILSCQSVLFPSNGISSAQNRIEPILFLSLIHQQGIFFLHSMQARFSVLHQMKQNRFNGTLRLSGFPIFLVVTRITPFAPFEP